MPSATARDIAVAAIFGDPVAHSKSPAMHNAAYAALSMNRTYAAFRVTPANLAAALRAVVPLGIVGVNLTVPHKEVAARYLKDLSAEARMLGAVNCVVNRRGKLRGDNTDAGGGAASSVLACKRLGASRVVIVNRTPARAAALARRLSARGITRAAGEPRGLDALMDSALLADAGLIVNATSMGLTTARFARLDYDSTAADCLFYDLIYAPEPTAFMKPALAAGRRAADGAGMLVNQGELAFKLFNRVAPPPGVMRAALLNSLGRVEG